MVLERLAQRQTLLLPLFIVKSRVFSTLSTLVRLVLVPDRYSTGQVTNFAYACGVQALIHCSLSSLKSNSSALPENLKSPLNSVQPALLVVIIPSTLLSIPATCQSILPPSIEERRYILLSSPRSFLIKVITLRQILLHTYTQESLGDSTYESR